MADLGNLSDAELVRQSKESPEGDLRAFEALISRYQEKILTNCRCITRSPDDAPDLAQEVFVKAFFGIKRFEGKSEFGTWITRIKVNHCLNFMKKHEGKVHVSTDDINPDVDSAMAVEPEAQERIDSMARKRRIMEVLEDIPDTLRLPLILRDLDGLSYKEIADDLKIGLSAVKMRIKRAREEFRRRFEDGEAVTP